MIPVGVPRTLRAWDALFSLVDTLVSNERLRPLEGAVGLGFTWYASGKPGGLHKLSMKLADACRAAGIFRGSPYLLRSQVVPPDAQGERLVITLEGT